MKTKLYNQSAEVVGEIELPDAIFSREVNSDLVHQALRRELAGQRRVLAHAKNRGEVRGGGRKPWPQKGTGRARHGSIRSPLWKGGGVTHGPTKERNFKRSLNKKMKRLAIASVLSEKAKRGDLTVVENLEAGSGKTKEIAKVFEKFLKKGKKYQRALVLVPESEKAFARAAKNLPYVKVIPPANVNLLDLLNHRYLITTKGALETLEKNLSHSAS